MTSRERMNLALNHQEPDLVPLDLGSTYVSGIHRIAYERLLELLGEGHREPLPLMDPVQQLAAPHLDLLDHLGVDTLSLLRHRQDRQVRDAVREEGFLKFHDAWGIGWRMAEEGGLYFSMYEHPLAGLSLEEVRDFPWPDPLQYLDLEATRAEAQRYFEETDKALIVGGFGSGLLEMTLYLQGYEAGFMNLVMEPELTGYIMDKVLEIKIRWIQALLPAVADYCQIFYFGDDVGHQDAPALSPQMFNDLLLPRYLEHNRAIRDLAPHLKIFFHTDGAVYPLLDRLAASGFDILNPIQVTAAGMDDTAKLKREWGDVFTFWGGLDTQEILPHATPEQVKAEVRRRLDDLAPGGGYVLNSVHNIQADVPPENILALVEARNEYGRY